MACYVDELRDYRDRQDLAPRLRKWWCHLTADTPEELHALAARIGMQRAWFQPSPPSSRDHYDLQPAKRALAVKLGAIEVDCATHMRAYLDARKAARLAAEQAAEEELECGPWEGVEILEYPD